MKKFMDLLPGDDKKESLESKKTEAGAPGGGISIKAELYGGLIK